VRPTKRRSGASCANAWASTSRSRGAWRSECTTTDGYSVELNLYQTSILRGQTPQALRVADFLWVASSEFDKYSFPAADQATMDLLLGVRRG